MVLVRWVLVILGRRVVLVLVVLVLVLGLELILALKLILVLVMGLVLVLIVLVIPLMGWHIDRVRVRVLRVLVLRLLVPSWQVRLVVRIPRATVEILVLVGVGLILTLILVLILISISPSEILVIPPWCVPLLPRNPILIRIVVPCGIGLLRIRQVIWLIIW